MSAFELELVGGPWERRLARRRDGFDELPWEEACKDACPEELEAGRCVWTESAFSEYASAASFAAIATALLHAGAPLDFVAAAGDFVVEETLHAELSARVAAALGGAVGLDVDYARLVRPPAGGSPVLRAAELLVRTSCVGEALTVSVLKAAAGAARSALVREVISRILVDESAHAQLGPWYLDWAASRLSTADRAHLGRVAGATIRAFTPIFEGSCGPSGAGALDCSTYDAAFREALFERVVKGLAAREIIVPDEDLAAVGCP